MSQHQFVGTGWVPDLPDRRDKLFSRAADKKKAGTAAKSKKASAQPTAELWGAASGVLEDRLKNGKGTWPGASKRLAVARKEAFPSDDGPSRKPLLLPSLRTARSRVE